MLHATRALHATHKILMATGSQEPGIEVIPLTKSSAHSSQHELAFPCRAAEAALQVAAQAQAAATAAARFPPSSPAAPWLLLLAAQRKQTMPTLFIT